MAVQRFTFPQSGDRDDAEFFASMIGQDNMTDYVESGLSFTYDSTVPEVQVGQGKAYIQLSQDTASSTGEDILDVNHVVQVPAQTVSLTDNALNYIYLQANLDTNDNGGVLSDTSTQTGDVLLIGTIDTSTDEVDEVNRAPSIEARALSLGDDHLFDFGKGDDFRWYYDSSEDRLALDNDSGTRLADVGDTDWQMEIDLDMRNNNIDDVASIDGGGNAVVFDDVIDLTAGLNTQGDIVDGTQVIWDESAQEIPDSAMGFIDNATLTNDSITLNSGDGLKNGSTAALGGSFSLDVEPADFAGTFLTDDGADNLQVDIGRGLEDDGTGAIQFDEDTAYIFTATQTFNKSILIDSDSESLRLGASQDFKLFHDGANDELVVQDLNGIELIRQTKGGATEFLQGINAGPIEAPQDSFTQVINSGISASPDSGDRVGYTFALDNQTLFGIDGTADGSGGLQGAHINMSNGEYMRLPEQSGPSGAEVGSLWYRTDLD